MHHAVVRPSVTLCIVALRLGHASLVYTQGKDTLCTLTIDYHSLQMMETVSFSVAYVKHRYYALSYSYAMLFRISFSCACIFMTFLN